MNKRPALVGIDWGTSSRRAYLLDEQGRPMRQHGDESGILAVRGDFEASLRELLQTLELDDADVVMSGMVGSRNGWQEAPYLPIEHPLSDLSGALQEVRTALPGVRCRVVPGYRYIDAHGVPDVMRGEEIQIFGALRLGAPSSWFVLPGTHSKWVRVEDGRVRELVTFMTGELFALMSQHGTLSKVMKGEEFVPAAFEAAVGAARHGGFTHTAFGCRALVVTDMMPPEHTASYLSGLLIGTEVREIGQRTAGRIASPVQIIGKSSLAANYRHALELSGIASQAWPPDEVYVAALDALLNLKR